MKLSDKLKEENAFVERKLVNTVICNRCGATLATYADFCTADLSEACPGFLTIEAAKKLFAEG